MHTCILLGLGVRGSNISFVPERKKFILVLPAKQQNWTAVHAEVVPPPDGPDGGW